MNTKFKIGDLVELVFSGSMENHLVMSVGDVFEVTDSGYATFEFIDDCEYICLKGKCARCFIAENYKKVE